jgi:hypothetical protein
VTPTVPDESVPDENGPTPEQLKALAGLRRRQGGAFTRAQALAAGHHPSKVRTLLRRQEWLDLERGIYVEARALQPDDPHGEHALRVAARNLAMGGGHAASRRSASLVLGLPLLGPVPEPAELTRSPRRRGDRSSASSVRVAVLDVDDVVRWRDVEVTAPARLVCDLARTHDQVEALMVADASLRAGLDRSRLVEAAARCARWTGAAALAEVLDAADGRVDSPLESLTRWVLRSLDIPAPLSQVDVFHRKRWLGRVDFAWPELGVVLESDGMSKYGKGTLIDEKRRELGLRRAGLEVLRSTWDDAWQRPEWLESSWHEHVRLAAARVETRRETTMQLARLEPTGVGGIPFFKRAARPLPAVVARRAAV